MQDENPYQAPLETSVVEPILDSAALPIASSNRRFLNLILDTIAFRGLAFAFGVVCGMVNVAPWPTKPIPDMLLGVVLFLLYYALQEAIWGRTLAKFITGTKVVTVAGTSPTVKQAIGRTLCRYIPFEAFSFLGESPVGWHDKFSGTRVVLVNPR
jgi:uncharacterized RDD family membrane protein YckC